MIQQLDLNQENILAFRITGHVDVEDFKAVANAIDQEFEDKIPFRLYIEIVDFDGMDLGVIWESLRFGVAHINDYLNHLDRIAVVTDTKWLHRVASMENRLLPSIYERTFSFDEKALAIEWVKEFTPDITM